jgi:ribosome-associated toxin RatA of RatAB toxin-antitoxin module
VEGPVAEQTEGSIEISAAPEALMAVVTDFEAYPEWADGIRGAEVVKRDSRGRPSEVAFEVSQMGIAATYTLAYRYKAASGGLSWRTKSASGAVKDITGDYSFEPVGDRTRVTYRTTIEPAIPMIGFVKRQAEKAIIKTALEGLKERVEGR